MHLLDKMKLQPYVIYDEEIWPYKSYQHFKSKDFMLAVKQGDYRQVKRLLSHYKFLVFQYDDCR